MARIEGCQLPCLPDLGVKKNKFDPQPFGIVIRRVFAVPWNYYVKKWLKRIYAIKIKINKNNRVNKEKKHINQPARLSAGDLVRVRSLEEIRSTLDPFNELKGCAFLHNMEKYCGSTQRVFKTMTRFLDERDYKVKKVRGIVLLEGMFCDGTPVFGRCDRACFLFVREEWLVKISE